MQTFFQQLFVWSAALAFFAGGFFIFSVIFPAPNFSTQTITVTSGQSITDTAESLANAGVVSFRYTVSIPLRLADATITAGTYKFSNPEEPLTIAQRLQSGDFRTEQTSITIPEGSTRQDIAGRIADKPSVSVTETDFLQNSQGQQGYLFPDTYQLSSDITAEEVVTKMQSNFQSQIQPLRPEINQSPRTLDEIITMASLIQREAAEYQTRRRVAGVLWNRFDQGMPLQVDAVFMYLIGKASSELTQEDLSTDSPYNLYENIGLPPTPIANPGLDAIKAAVNPKQTDYMYYLTGNDGRFHFAETLKQHNANKQRYLQN
jgi:UPF0755 protein